MQKLVSFLEKSVQWLAVGIAGVFLLLCVYWYLLTPPATAKVANKAVTPSEIDTMTQNGPINDIGREIKMGTAEPIKVAEVIQPWKQKITNPTLVAIVPNPWNSATGQLDTGPTGHENDVALVTTVAAFPKATPVSVQAGMSVAAPLAAANGQGVVGAVNFNVIWASAAFSIPGKELQAAFEKPLQGKPQNFEQFYRTAYLNIELQHQRATGHDAAGTAIFPDGDAGVETVTTAKVNQNEIQPLPTAKAANDTKASFAQWAETNELNILQPKFYDIKAGDPYVPAVLPNAPAAPGAAAAPVAPRPVAPAPGVNPAPGAAAGGKQPGRAPADLANDQLVWAHDDSVEPGRTYRYRVVYHMKNPVFALENIADPKIINQLDIASAPSDWSGQITIPANVQYFVMAVHSNGTATVAYYKWDLGVWNYKKLELAAGDMIPGTDQLFVDTHVTTNPNGRQQKDLMLLADASGELIRRSANEDRGNATWTKLKGLTSPAPAAPGGGPAPRTPAGAAAPRASAR